MKVRIPYDRHNLKIKRKDKVLEIGSGHNPTYRSNVLVEKFVTDNYHRSGTCKVYPHQKLVQADGGKLPFSNNEFDYVICNQVLEHAEDPAAFLQEQMRVSTRGYIETPSLLGELLFPKKSHKWVVLLIDNKLVLFEKSLMPGNYENNYGELFLNYLPYHSLVFKLLGLTEGSIMLNRYEWSGAIDYLINPTDRYYQSFFTQAWNREMVTKLFPSKPLLVQLFCLLKASCYLVKRQLFAAIFSRVISPPIEVSNSV